MKEQAYNGTGALAMEEPVTTVQTAPRAQAPQQAPPQKKPAEEAESAHPWHAIPALVGSLLLVAAVVVMVLVSYAQLVVVNDELVGLRSQLDTLKSEETKLMSQYELAYDLQEIENQMTASGKMNSIQSWQTYTLELSEPDSVEYYHASDAKERAAAFARDLVTGVKEYFGLGIT